MPYYHPNFDVRKKFCQVYMPDPAEECYEIADRFHEVVDEKIMPLRHDLDGGYHHDRAIGDEAVAKAMQVVFDFGWPLGIFPEELGGPGGVMDSTVTYCMLAEELGRADVGVSLDVSLLYWFFSPIKFAGRMDMLEKWGAPLKDGKHHRAVTALTEPTGGANVDDSTQHGRTIRTICKRDGDEWVINGLKIWPSGATLTDIGYMTLCTTDPNLGDEGLKFILVPSDAEGLSFGEPIHKTGMCCTDTNTKVFFDNVRVPLENAVTWGTDVRDADLFKELAVEDRITNPAQCTGALQACIELLLDFTRDRVIAGKPMREHSVFVHALGGILTQWTAARAAYMEAAYMFDHPEKYGMPWEPFMYNRAAAVNQHAMMGIRQTMNTVLDLMGSYGLSHEHHVEKYFRDVKQAELWLGGRFRNQMDVMLQYYDYDWTSPKWEPAKTEAKA